jgi:hypothetical protein
MIAHNPASVRRDKALSVIGIAGLGIGAALILLLQFIPPTNAISPLRRTISEYALSANKWVFDLAVGLVALGSILGFIVLIRRGALTVFSWASALSALWIVGLLVVIAYPKTNWAVGPSSGGTVHRIASVVAFLCLPIAILLLSRFTESLSRRRITRWLAIASLAWFGVILGAILIAVVIGGQWWQLIPLGLVERLLAITELFALASLMLPARISAPDKALAEPELVTASADA